MINLVKSFWKVDCTQVNSTASCNIAVSYISYSINSFATTDSYLKTKLFVTAG